MFSAIIIFIIILSILIFAHEIGHFLMARKFGVKAEEFGFGFPPRMIGIQHIGGKRVEPIGQIEEKKVVVSDVQVSDSMEIVSAQETDTVAEVDKVVPFKKWRVIWGNSDPKPVKGGVEVKEGTIYSINWLPLGGFVKIKGEQGEYKQDSDSFVYQKIWKRLIILSAGVLMNLFIAAVFLGIGFMIGLPQTVEGVSSNAHIEERNIQVMRVVSDSPAELAGVQMGDIVVAINSKAFTTYEELSNFVASKEGEELQYKIKRGEEEFQLAIVPEFIAEANKAGIGIIIAETGIVSYPWYQAIWEGVKATIFMTWYIIVAFWLLLKGLITGQGMTAELAGPVGIAVITGQVARLGFIYILQFTAILSINLAIINYLPFPALDGGRVLFLLIEKIRGKAVPEKVEAVFHNIGFALLMLLVLLVTFRDVLKFWG